MENVKPRAEKKVSNDTHSGRGTPFDLESIMIYGPTDFGIENSSGEQRTTIQPLDPTVETR